MESLEAILVEYKAKIDNASTESKSITGKIKRMQEFKSWESELITKIHTECTSLNNRGVPKLELKEKATSIIQQLLKYAVH